jgi:hypothetical protein
MWPREQGILIKVQEYHENHVFKNKPYCHVRNGAA